MSAQPTRVSITFDPERIAAPSLDCYLRYWRAKRADRPLPSRSELRPSEIKAHLPSMALVEAISGLDDFRFRLVGTGVAQHLLAHATGRTIRETYATAEASYVEGVIRLHQTVCRKKLPVLVQSSAGSWFDLFYPAFDVLYLPFADDAGNAAFIVTAYSFPEQERLTDLSKDVPTPAVIQSLPNDVTGDGVGLR